MKGQSVPAVILVLLCFRISFGNGDERIENARKALHYHYGKLLYYSKDSNTLRGRSTIYRHLSEVNDKENKWQSWLQEDTGYSHEQLSNLGGSMNKNELKLATEYQLWLSLWYYVRFITLKKAAELDCYVGKRFPRKVVCMNAASTALKHFKDHKNMYTQRYQALDEKAQKSIMKNFKFPNYIHSEEQNHQYAERDAFISIRSHLETMIKRFLRRRMSMKSRFVRSISFIQESLTPGKMTLNENFLSEMHNFFPVHAFSQPPDEASRSDVEFLEVAWLFNQYRSLWYELRRNDLLEFLQHTKQDRKEKFIQRVEDASEFINKLFQKYDSLCRDYYKVLKMHHPEGIAVAQSTPVASNSVEVDSQILIYEDEMQWRGKRERTALDSVSKNVRAHKIAEKQSLDAEKVRSSSPKLHQSVARPDFDLNAAPPEIAETKENIFLADAHPELHSNLVLGSEGNHPQSHQAMEIGSVATKRLKLTRSEENYSPRYLRLDDLHQSPSEKHISEYTRTLKNSYSSRS